jgi:hypothetical protein
MIRLTSIVLLTLPILIACEPSERGHAQILGGQLKYLYTRWSKEGYPTDFQPTNFITAISDRNSKPPVFFVFTNVISIDGTPYHCRFGVRSTTGTRFYRGGVLAITDEGLIAWIGDDGKVVLAPDTKNWSSR